MKIEITEATWISGPGGVSLDELAELSGLAESELRELVALDAFEPVDPGASRWTFRSECVAIARTACRLKSDLDLDTHAVSVALAGQVFLSERVHQFRAAAAYSLARKRMISVVPPTARHSIFTGVPWRFWCQSEKARPNS